MSEEKKDPLTRVLEESQKSLFLDIHHITDEIARTPLEISKWLERHSVFLLELRNVESEIEGIYLELFEYYQGKSEIKSVNDRPFPKKVLKGDVDLYINADKKYQAKLSKREKILAIIKVCEQTLKTLNGRSFDIKNYIEYEKFKHGVN